MELSNRKNAEIKSMLTVIVVCFNEQKRIGKTLESILRQTYKNIECIIVDGGSKDGTLELIETYQEEFIRAGTKTQVISEPDQGIYDAMNKGIKCAAGEWIYFLNAGDDFYEEETVRKVFDNRKKEDEILIGKIIFFDGYLGKVVEQCRVEELKENMVFCHQAIFALKELLQTHYFKTSYRYCADYEWLLAMYMNGRKIRCIDTVIANYDADGISNNYAELSKREMQRIRKEYGFTENINNKQKINWKYKFYKRIGKYKALSRCFYFMYGRNREYFLKKV